MEGIEAADSWPIGLRPSNFLASSAQFLLVSIHYVSNEGGHSTLLKLKTCSTNIRFGPEDFLMSLNWEEKILRPQKRGCQIIL